MVQVDSSIVEKDCSSFPQKRYPRTAKAISTTQKRNPYERMSGMHVPRTRPMCISDRVIVTYLKSLNQRKNPFKPCGPPSCHAHCMHINHSKYFTESQPFPFHPSLALALVHESESLYRRMCDLHLFFEILRPSKSLDACQHRVVLKEGLDWAGVKRSVDISTYVLRLCSVDIHDIVSVLVFLKSDDDLPKKTVGSCSATARWRVKRRVTNRSSAEMRHIMQSSPVIHVHLDSGCSLRIVDGKVKVNAI